MSYESWRISFQSSEQAARAAYDAWRAQVIDTLVLGDTVDGLKEDLNKANTLLDAVAKKPQGAIAIGLVSRDEMGKLHTIMDDVISRLAMK